MSKCQAIVVLIMCITLLILLHIKIFNNIKKLKEEKLKEEKIERFKEEKIERFKKLKTNEYLNFI